MAVTITAALVGVADPPVVQVAVDGLTLGTHVKVKGNANGRSWTVRGSDKLADSTQLVVADDLGAINTPITYRVWVDGVSEAAASPVTVPFATDQLIGSLDMATVIAVQRWQDNALPLDVGIDQHFTTVPGRANPVLRFAAAGGTSGRWRVRLDAANSEALMELAGAGAPVVLRSTGAARDLPASKVVALTAVPSSLWGGVNGDDHRVFDLSWVGQDDPFADVVVAADTFAEVDAGYAGTTFAELDAAYSGSTFADFNLTDWEGLGA